MAVFTGSVFSQTLQMDTSLTVAAPRKNLSVSQPYPVIYLLHGLTDNHLSWLNNSQIPLLAEKYGVVFVMPDCVRSFYTDLKFGLRYFTYVSEELPRLVRNLFQVSDKREETGVFGFSMGGYGALKCALLHPERYGFTAAFSSCCDIHKLEETVGAGNPELQGLLGVSYEQTEAENLYRMLERAAQKEPQPRFYMTCGTEDYLLQMNRDFAKAMEEKKMDCLYREGPGGHEWYFWNRSVHDAMHYFFPEVEA